MTTMLLDSLSAAFRGGAIARTAGLRKDSNPFSKNNMTLDEEQQWFEGYMEGGLFLLELHTDEVIKVIEEANVSRTNRMFAYANILTCNKHEISKESEIKLCKISLSNADSIGDQQYLKAKLDKLE